MENVEKRTFSFVYVLKPLITANKSYSPGLSQGSTHEEANDKCITNKKMR